MSKFVKNELQNILRGKSKVSNGTLIQTITNYLGKSEGTSSVVEKKFEDKIEETENLKDYIYQNNLWIVDFDFSSFISEGAEQRVFIKDHKIVYKLNDSIYYEFWFDYFVNLLFNNYFFPDTAYKLVGFYEENTILYAIVEQNYIKANEITDLDKVKSFLISNGFANNRNYDYYNEKLGIILEDLHDENVLTKDRIQYFIDTVFYIKPEIFWN